jgi:NAD(P)-dependent dehydrogenase (short-subunit alcohol dehydrogenase family)
VLPPAGSVALVTGAGSGMGQLSAWRLAAAGVTVAALDVDEAGLATTARSAQIHPFPCDVRDVARITEVVDQVEADLGPIHRVVNAAAVPHAGPLLDQPLADIALVVEVNYLGLVNVTKVVLPHLLARGEGELVQFGSLAGWLPSPWFGAYSAAKAAVVSFNETLGHELAGTGVKLVCLCPPMVETPMLERFRQSGPPGFDAIPRIRPEEVLDAAEVALERGKLFAFPGRGTPTVWRLRRFVPQLLWKRLDAVSQP